MSFVEGGGGVEEDHISNRFDRQRLLHTHFFKSAMLMNSKDFCISRYVY